jgi:hypothetical protein
MIMVPDELGTEAGEFLNQRLTKKDRERKRQYSKKLDSAKQKKKANNKKSIASESTLHKKEEEGTYIIQKRSCGATQL